MNHEQMHLMLEEASESIHVSGWDDGGVWMNLAINRASVRVILTKKETQRLIEMLQLALPETVAGDNK
jgi:hypothetical protein